MISVNLYRKEALDPAAQPLGTRLDTRLDSIVWNDLAILQWRHGYHFNRDSVVLARSFSEFLSTKIANPDRRTGVCLGAGCGVVPIVLLRSLMEQGMASNQLPKITGVEIQASLCLLAQQNIAMNQMQNLLEINQGDVREIERCMGRGLKPGSVDFVLCNPPYYAVGSGRINQDREQAVARHSLHGDIGDFVQAAAFILRKGGYFSLVFPFERKNELLRSLDEAGFGALNLREVRSTPAAAPFLLLVRARLGLVADCEFVPPLIYRDEGGEDTPEVSRLFGDACGSGSES